MTVNIIRMSKMIREGIIKQKEEAPKKVEALIGEELEYKGKKAKLLPRANLPDGTVYRLYGMYLEKTPSPFYTVEYDTGRAFGGDSLLEAERNFKSHVDWEENIYNEYDKIFNS